MEITVFSEILKGSKKCISFSGNGQSGNVHKIEGGVVLSIWKNGSSAMDPCDAVLIPDELLGDVTSALKILS